MKAEASPFNKVRDNIHDIRKVKATPIRTTPTTVPAAMNEVKAGEKRAATKTVASIIKVAKRPLQGTKLLVRMAIRRSRGESITRVATTPAALHPNPIAIVREAEAAGAKTPDEIVKYAVQQLKSKNLRFSVEDPDAAENWPRVWYIWRARRRRRCTHRLAPSARRAVPAGRSA